MSDEDDIFNEDDYEFGDEDEYEADDVADSDEDEADEDDSSDDDAPNEEAAKAQEEEEPEPEEEEEDVPPDDEKAVAALQNISVRLDVNDKGNVWRVIFDERNGTDDALVLLGGLPGLKEVWLLGTKVTKEAAEQLKEDRPKLTVYR